MNQFIHVQLKVVQQVEEPCRFPPILPIPHIHPICLAPPKLALLLLSIQHLIPSEVSFGRRRRHRVRLLFPPRFLCLGCRIDKLSDTVFPSPWGMQPQGAALAWSS